MALGILYDEKREAAAYYDSVTGTAFGTLFTGYDAREQAEHFAIWLKRQPGRTIEGNDDPRALSHAELERMRGLWAESYLDEDGNLTDTGHEEVP